MSALLSVRDLRKSWHTRRGPVRAVAGVSFDVGRRETVGLVGESGCGKSTVAMSLLRLNDPDGGEVEFEGTNLSTLGRRQERAMRRRLSIVFQNPYSSLNPRMRVRDIVGEPIRTSLGLPGGELRRRVQGHLEEVGLGAEHMERYPHEFSGGQRQRIAIARAVALEPAMLVLDEPTSALDVSVQAQVLALLARLQADRGMSYLFISHNLAVVEQMCDRVLVMYLGRIVESGPVTAVFRAPRHPYTRALLDSIPSLDPALRNRLRPVPGEVPSPLDQPPGCPFAPRCPRVRDHCRQAEPPLEARSDGHAVACYHPLAQETES